MRRYERTSTILTSNRPLDDWPKLFGDTPAVAAFLDRLMHHSHLIEIRGKATGCTSTALPSAIGTQKQPLSQRL
jgi:DNA replication protein DnaC